MLFNNFLAATVLALSSVGAASPVAINGDIAANDSPILA
jgi:hypothetical protein